MLIRADWIKWEFYVCSQLSSLGTLHRTLWGETRPFSDYCEFIIQVSNRIYRLEFIWQELHTLWKPSSGSCLPVFKRNMYMHIPERGSCQPSVKKSFFFGGAVDGAGFGRRAATALSPVAFDWKRRYLINLYYKLCLWTVY